MDKDYHLMKSIVNLWTVDHLKEPLSSFFQKVKHCNHSLEFSYTKLKFMSALSTKDRSFFVVEEFLRYKLKPYFSDVRKIGIRLKLR